MTLTKTIQELQKEIEVYTGSDYHLRKVAEAKLSGIKEALDAIKEEIGIYSPVQNMDCNECRITWDNHKKLKSQIEKWKKEIK